MTSRRGKWGARHVRTRRDDELANLDPLEFERVVADYYRKQGYDVEECGTGGTGRGFDGGIDLKLRGNGEYVVVQCKRHNAYQLTHNPVHELLGVAGTEGADRCILVNTGEYTRYAWEVAAKNSKLELIDGAELRRMLPELAQPVPGLSETGVVAGGSPRMLSAGGKDYSLSIPNAKPTPFRKTVRDSRHNRDPDAVPAIWITGAIVLALVIAIRQCSGSGSLGDRPATGRTHVPVTQPQVPVPQAAVGHAAVRADKASSRPPSTPRRYTREELREQQRRADEAIKVIEASTPEM
ncbi:restriction endonuclease [Novilysobacter arseniciresistens]|uniref:restriction endonuclease n=1 Tax=Novilysobacter arseniciresistens TaxID=1385522 RepID=UPI00068C4C23|nr:restriction endonuclease [Lysobacter arseniciresistens]